MSWLARSLVNSLGTDDDGEHSLQQNNQDVSPDNDSAPVFNAKSSLFDSQNRPYGALEEDEDQSRGVKDDLSEFGETLTRQLFGVAGFLAPPPPPPLPHLASSENCADQVTVAEFDPPALSDRSGSGDDTVQEKVVGEDFNPSDVGELAVGKMSRFSDSDQAQTVVNDYRSDTIYGHLESRAEEPDRTLEVVGVTDEVLAFAGNIAHHPETWLDFPVEEEDDEDDFDMSESQKEHAIAIECLTPRLKALRIELCPTHMSEGYFWKVYFVLLHSRLNKHDAKVLSTPQVVEARAEWMRELQTRAKEELERQRFYKENSFPHDDSNPSSPCFHQPDDYPPLWSFGSEPACSTTACDSETEKHPLTQTHTEFDDKCVIEERPVVKTFRNIADEVSSPKPFLHNFLDNDDGGDDNDWPEEDLLEDGKNLAPIPFGIEEEVSFSDLEDDDCSLHEKYNIRPIS